MFISSILHLLLFIFIRHSLKFFDIRSSDLELSFNGCWNSCFYTSQIVAFLTMTNSRLLMTCRLLPKPNPASNLWNRLKCLITDLISRVIFCITFTLCNFLCNWTFSLYEIYFFQHLSKKEIKYSYILYHMWNLPFLAYFEEYILVPGALCERLWDDN